jgi:hypothetical protein
MTRQRIDVTVTRTIHGYYECSTIHNARLVRYTYGGFLKREAIRRFREYVRSL